MEAIMRSVPAGTAEEADVGEAAPSFEEFYEATFRRLFSALCLVTGNRQEGEEVAQEAYVRVFERWEHVGVLEDPTVMSTRGTPHCRGTTSR
jgi:DNA-directed RNA polymerase specialized sigma24 family protein